MLLDQDITKRIKLRKTVKIKVMVIRYRGTPPSLVVAKGVPIPDTQFFFVGGDGGDFVDGVGLLSFFQGIGSPS